MGSLGNYTITASKAGYGVPLPQALVLSTAGETYDIGTLFMDQEGPSATLNLGQGWNFISFPVQPSNTAPATVLAPVIGKVLVVWAWDSQKQQWLLFAPQRQENSLLALESGKGYWIYLTGSASLTVYGTSGVTTIPLADGWNLVGYNGGDDVAVATGLSTISTRWSYLWNWEGSTWKAASASTMQLPVPALTSLSSGKAYWIRIKAGQAGDWAQ